MKNVFSSMFLQAGLKYAFALGAILASTGALAQRVDRGQPAIHGVPGVADDGHAVQSFVMPAGKLTLIYGEGQTISAVSYERADGRVSMELVDQNPQGRNSKDGATYAKNDLLDEGHGLRCIRCYDGGTWGIWALSDEDGKSIGYLIIDKDGDIHFSPKSEEK